MMETKLWAAALCALLLITSGSADQNNTATTTAAVTEAGPVSKAAHSESDPTGDPTSHGLIMSHPHSSLNGISGLGNNTTTNPEVTAVTSTREKSVDQTTQPPSDPPRPTSVDPPTIPHTPISTTIVSPTRAHTLLVDVTVTRSPGDNTSHNPAPALPDSSSNPPSQNDSTPSTLVPTSQPPVPEHTSVALNARPTSTSSTTSSPQPHSSPSSTHTSPSDSRPGTITKAQSTTITITTTTTTTPTPTPTTTTTTTTTTPTPTPTTTTTTTPTPTPTTITTTTTTTPTPTTTKSPYSPSAQAKTHTEDSSLLNVGNDPTMLHDSPTLDPLLAGLVSAFIITAVIITLLLFLKLRRRDNRPEFRRLQDLPMDDMMEDTPLSMYSY